MGKILICDDQKDIVRILNIYLSGAGYETVLTYDGTEALAEAERLGDGLDLVLLDIMMPGKDGLTVLSELREKSTVPVILLTAKSEDADKVCGLDGGADDYVTKPFNATELLARVKAQLRRYRAYDGPDRKKGLIRVGALEIDDERKTVTRDGDPVSLTPTEYDILLLLARNPGCVMSIREIYERITGTEAYGAEGSIPVHIRHLREKIEYDPSSPVFLKVVWGRGYRIEGKDKK